MAHFSRDKTMIITVVTVDGIIKYAAESHNRAERYAQNMSDLYPDAEIKTWPIPVDLKPL